MTYWYLQQAESKTHIMSHANLNSEQMNYYFNTLLSHSLLNAEKDSDDNLVYKTTHKGVRFLHCCAADKVTYCTSGEGKNAERSPLPLEAIELSSYTIKRNTSLPLSDVLLSDAGRRASGKGSTGREYQTIRRGQVPFHVSNNPSKKCRKAI